MKKIILVLSLACCVVHSASAQVTIDFESWNPFTVSGVQLTEPVSWSGSDSFIVGVGKLLKPNGTFQAQLFKDSPGYAGAGALRVTTKIQDSIIAPGIVNFPARPYPGIATNSQIVIDPTNNTFSNKGGNAITFNAYNTSMYVKNTIVSGDSTFITAVLIDNGDGGDSVIAVADTVLTTNISSYTKITIPFVYDPTTVGSTATLVRFTISSGNPGGLLDSTNSFSVHDGTEIIIDNIELNNPLGIRQVINSKLVANVYPTIGSENLYIDLLENSKQFVFELFASNGQKVFSENITTMKNKISLSQLSAGNYIYSLRADNVIYQTGKLVR